MSIRRTEIRAEAVLAEGDPKKIARFRQGLSDKEVDNLDLRVFKRLWSDHFNNNSHVSASEFARFWGSNNRGDE